MDPVLGIILAVVAVVAVIALVASLSSGGSEEAETPRPRYRVTLFSGGEKVETFEVTDYEYGDGEVTLYRDGNDKQLVLIGTFIIEPLYITPASPDRLAEDDDETLYRIKLYDGGKVVGEWTTTGFESSGGQISFYPRNCEEQVLTGGTAVIEEIDPNAR